MELHFSNRWFEKNQRSWHELLEPLGPKNILEVGTYEGQSTVCVANMTCSKETSPIKITCIDTWSGGREHNEFNMTEVEMRYDNNMKALLAKYRGKLEIRKLKSNSHDAMISLIESGEAGSYDFAYIDGSHDACDVLFDAVLAFKLIRKGGVMCFDDFLWHSGDSNPLRTPRQGIESFISCYRDQIFLGDSGQARQCWIAKK